MRFILLAFILLFLITGCNSANNTVKNKELKTTQEEWTAVNDFLYRLQRADPKRIGETAYDLVIIQIGASGSSRKVIEDLKRSPGGKKLVLCYMSR